jgi:hypothetical protein
MAKSQFAWGAPAGDTGTVVGHRAPEGFPILSPSGAVPDLKGDQIDELPARLACDAHMFLMWVDADREAYVRIMDAVANGQASITARRELIAKTEETGLVGENLKIWLEWGTVYLVAEPPRQNVPLGGRR